MSKSNNKLPQNAMWKKFEGKGQHAHFYHANGFSLGVYTPLLKLLSNKFNLSALAWRATWPGMGMPPKRRDWQIYADDLITFIAAQRNTPVIGIGHSMGATCMVLAAQKRPDLFESLVLIEPAMVSRPIAKLVRIIPEFVMNVIEPAKSTLKKPDCWPSREAYYEYCTKIRGYKRFSKEAFQAMAQYGVSKIRDGEYQLSFPKIWEAHNYTQPPNVLSNLENLTMPCVAIRGRPSVFFTESMWQEWQRCCPDTIFKQNLSYGHLLPLENPSICFDLICTGLSEIEK